jgi:putative membrane protein
MVMLWAASDWPIHDLGEQYLYSVHMLQHMMLSYFLPPLALLATPEWLLRALIGNGASTGGAMAVSADCRRTDLQPGGDGHARAGGRQRVRRERSAALRPARPRRDDVAVDVDARRGSVPGVPPRPGRHDDLPVPPIGGPDGARRVARVAEGVVYKHYGEQPFRVWGISPTDDQQLAGAVMKVGGSMFLWTIVVYVFFKKLARCTRVARLPARVQMPTAEITGHDEAPLTTADVEREFARVPAIPEPD